MKSFVQLVSCKSSKSVETIPNKKGVPSDRPNSSTSESPDYRDDLSNFCLPSESLSNQHTKPQTKPLNFQNFSSSFMPAIIPKIMPQIFEDKIVLVTGSSGGIGAATVKYFAQAGAKVVVNGRNQNNIAVTAAECDSLSPKSECIFSSCRKAFINFLFVGLVCQNINHYKSRAMSPSRRIVSE